MQYAKIVGNRFRPTECQEAFMALEPGDPLVLRKEPENPYDAEAIKVETPEGLHLGYIPRTDTPRWNPHFEDTLKVEFEAGERVYSPDLGD